MTTDVLMIGNYIKVNDSIEIVKSISKRFIKTESGKKIFNKNIKGIPIEHILNKYQKNLDGVYMRYYIGKFGEYNENIFIEDRDDKYSIVRSLVSNYWICDVKYVHEIQNLMKFYGVEFKVEL